MRLPSTDKTATVSDNQNRKHLILMGVVRSVRSMQIKGRQKTPTRLCMFVRVIVHKNMKSRLFSLLVELPGVEGY